MINNNVVKNGIVYRIYKDKWGSHKRYYLNFSTMTQYHVDVVGVTRLRVSECEDRILLNYRFRPLADHVQQYYKDWCEEEVERLLTGGDDGLPKTK